MIIGGIDIGGTKIATGLINEQGQLLASASMPTAPELGLPHAIERIRETFANMQRSAGVGDMQGIGIACTGPVDPLSGELAVNTFLPGWEGLGLMQALEQCYHLPLAMENDADAAALAEGRWGSGQGSHSFLYLTVSTGIGSGLILDGRLYRGANGAHAEMGHHTIDPSGPLCFCGARGCWEALASGPALAAWYNGQQSGGPELDAGQVCEQARAGSPLAMRAVKREAHYLGLGLANLLTLFMPERIALGGGVMNSWPLFEPLVRQTIQQNCGLVPYQFTQLSLAQLGPQVNLLGAGQAWFHRYLSRP